MRDEDQPSPPVVVAAREAAARNVERFMSAAEAAGYGFAVISIDKLLIIDGHMYSPGSTGYVLSEELMPGVPSYVATLRHVADSLEELWRDSGAPEATHGYRELVYDRVRRRG